MKRKIFFISLIILIITLLVISNTYALFETNASGTGDFEVGKWTILVNENDLSVANTVSITDFTLSQSAHTADNYFAPGRTATFEVEIDATETDVSLSYDLTMDNTAIVDHPNITISILNVNTNQIINSNTISGIIGVNDQNRVLTLNIVLTWDDVPLYNEADTALIGENLNFAIAAHFEQYLGE